MADPTPARRRKRTRLNITAIAVMDAFSEIAALEAREEFIAACRDKRIYFEASIRHKDFIKQFIRERREAGIEAAAKSTSAGPPALKTIAMTAAKAPVGVGPDECTKYKPKKKKK